MASIPKLKQSPHKPRELSQNPPNIRSLRCLFLAPADSHSDFILRRKIRPVLDKYPTPISLHTLPMGSSWSSEATWAAIAAYDFVIAETTKDDPTVFYQIGMAQAMPRATITLRQLDSKKDRRHSPLPANSLHIDYLASLDPENTDFPLAKVLDKIIADNLGTPINGSATADLPRLRHFVRDLSPSTYENLVFELLHLEELENVAWIDNATQVQIAARRHEDLVNSDSDRLLLVSVGFPASDELSTALFLEDVSSAISKISGSSLQPARAGLELLEVTLLFVWSPSSPPLDQASPTLAELLARLATSPVGAHLRLRWECWDFPRILAIIKRHPLVATRYEPGGSMRTSSERQTIEELYRQSLATATVSNSTVAKLQNEHRIAVERGDDTGWLEVAYSGAHNFGNIVAALEINLDTLLREPRLLDEIGASMRRSIEKAKRTIHRFKKLSRIESINPEPVQIVDVMDRSLDTARKRGFKVSLHAHPDCPEAVADIGAIEDCFDELVANALNWVRHRETPEIVVTVDEAIELPSKISLSGDRRYLQVIFRDNGPGVEFKDKERIFAPFFSRYPQGTGLGLSFLRRTVEVCGGTTFEDGEPGSGARFQIFLPMSAEPNASPTIDLQKSLRSPHNGV